MSTNINSSMSKLYCDSSPMVALIFIIALTLLSFTSKTYATESCLPTMARVVSVQGVIELRRAEHTDWEPATMNTALCAGDMIRTRSDSRASLRLNNESMLRLKQRTTVTFPKIQTNESRSLLDILNGVIHIITRTPIPFQVRTPFVNANVEGTEFLVNVDKDSTRLVIYEGQVTASNDYGDLRLVDNEAAITFQNQAPQKDVIVHPTDAVQWALHYPTIIDGLNDATSQDEQSANFLIHQAGRLLIVGSVDEATLSIEQALTLEPNNSDAYALQSIIAVVQNDKDQALNFAIQAVERDPTSSTAKLALSYAQQTHFDIEDALATVHEAVKLDSQNSLAWARLAELQMSVGELDRALDAAQQAVHLNPNIAKTRTVLGFAYLLQINTEDAKTVFNEAILLDQADPMPRLGLGLALIREGELEAGRIELEIAASLDPANSLIRSYLGKAYFEEKRYSLAGTQFDMAKKRDPHDPTPWFYDAIQKQTQNHPVEALQDIQKSIELNDNRAVYRSKLLLDQDEASRGSSLARIFSNLGFEKRARMETAKSLSVNPANHSAHRFLSDSYINTPRHEIARVSELLQAQLMQPINVNPVQPHLAVADLNIITGTGPSATGFNEFSPLMERNKPQLIAAGIAGNNGTLGNEMVFSTLHDRTSVSLGQFHHETNGFRPNNDQAHNIYNAFIQHAFTPKLNVQAEVRSRETIHGDLLQDFDPQSFNPGFKRKINQDTARIGTKYSLSPNQDFLFSVMYTDRDVMRTEPKGGGALVESIKLEEKGYQVEAQHILRRKHLKLISGGSSYRINTINREHIDIAPQFLRGKPCPPSRCDPSRPDFVKERHNGYIYANAHYYSNFITTLGLSFDSFKDGTNYSATEINPKFGLQWSINNHLRIRAAWFETLKSSLIANQTLEPTQVAGFNQFFDDGNGTKSRRKGLGLDVRITNNSYAGIEVSKRNLNVPNFLDQSFNLFEKQNELLHRAYLYWTPHPYWSVKGEFKFERYRRNPNSSFIFDNDATRIKTLTAPLSVKYFHPKGLFSSITGTFVEQNIMRKGDLGQEKERNPETTNSGIDTFFMLDAVLGYRLPNRRGILSLEGRNLLDKNFFYQNFNFQRFTTNNIITTRFLPDRTLLARLTLNF